MSNGWTILHGGALGDLVLTLQLALRLPVACDERGLHVISRTNPGDLSACRPAITRQSSEGLGLHWLFGDHDDPPPQRLREQIAGRHVLSALAGAHIIVHHRLQELAPAALASIDPRPHDGVERHITQQWQTQLEAQGLLVPKCIHQKPQQRSVGVPETLRARGRALLAQAGSSPEAILVHPGSGGRSKCWPTRAFLAVARELRDHHGASPTFLIGPVELETWPPADLDALAREFPLLRNPTPDELVALLAAARAYLGNDAGPAHLAALLGTPTTVIFGPTSPSIWHPLGAHVRILTGDPHAHPADWGLNPVAVAAAIAQNAGA